MEERWWGELKRGGGGEGEVVGECGVEERWWGSVGGEGEVVGASVEVIRWGRGGMEAVDDYHRVRDSLEVE